MKKNSLLKLALMFILCFTLVSCKNSDDTPSGKLVIYDLNDHHLIPLLDGRDNQNFKEWLKNIAK